MNQGMSQSGLGCVWAEPNGIEEKWLLGEFIWISLGAANGV